MTPATLQIKKEIVTSTKINELVETPNIEVNEEKQHIIDRIKLLEEQLQTLKGTECLIYSRVVGYFSPTNNWNKGKASEWKDRTPFNKIEEG
jgi:anaerobic ribonucleoside-triphosphate reductase